MTSMLRNVMSRTSSRTAATAGRRAAPVAAVLLALATTFAQAAPPAPPAHDEIARSAAPLPREHRQGEVVWMSGGIGLDESQAMQRAAPQWPLTVEFARRDGARSDYLADVEVLVRDSRGHEVLGTRAQGPFLMAKLNPGRYTVEAARGDHVIERQVVVRAGQPARVLMLWPQRPDTRTGEHHDAHERHLTRERG